MDIEDDNTKIVDIKKFGNLEGKFLLVKVGNKNRPATAEDIKKTQDHISFLFKKNNVNCLAFVTHHCVEVEVMDSALEMEIIDRLIKI